MKLNEAVWSEISEWIASYTITDEEYILFGTGGNINKARKLLARGPNQVVSYAELINLKKQLESLTLGDRMKKFQLRPDRADAIVPAIEIYTRLISNFKSNFIQELLDNPKDIKILKKNDLIIYSSNQ